MQVRPLTSKRSYSPKPSAEQSKAGLVQKGLGAVAGAAIACVRAPTAFVSGSIVGVYKGWQIGRKSDHKASAQNTAHCMMFAGTTSALLRTGTLGFLAAGPIGAAVAIGQQSLISGADTLLAIKGGSAEEQGKEVFETLEQGIEAGGGALKGALKGFSISGISGGKAALKTGFGEGNGAVAGLFEGIREIPEELASAEAPKGKGLTRIARAVGGAVGAALAAPGGLVFGLLCSMNSGDEKPSKELSPLKRRLVATASTAAAGAALGFALGPVGMVLGGVAGGLTGLTGRSAQGRFQEEVKESVERAQANNQESSNPVGDKYRDMLQGMIVGGASGVRQAWNGSVEGS